jgi:hypothetical protein
MVFADVNLNGAFEADEIVGEHRLTLSMWVPTGERVPCAVRRVSEASRECDSRAWDMGVALRRTYDATPDPKLIVASP